MICFIYMDCIHHTSIIFVDPHLHFMSNKTPEWSFFMENVSLTKTHFQIFLFLAKIYDILGPDTAQSWCLKYGDDLFPHCRLLISDTHVFIRINALITCNNYCFCRQYFLSYTKINWLEANFPGSFQLILSEYSTNYWLSTVIFSGLIFDLVNVETSLLSLASIFSVDDEVEL